MRKRQSKAKTLLGSVLLALLGFTVARAGPASAQNALSRAIERAQPCKDIKVKKFGVSVGIDKFKSATLESLKVDVDGDEAKVSAVGSLACQTSDHATFNGDASARFDASAALNLTSCSVSQRSFHVLSTGGTYGFALEAAKGSIEKLVEKGIDDQVKALCH